MNDQDKINQRVIQAAEQVLQNQRYLSALEVLMTLGWLQYSYVEDWKRGKIPYLEPMIQGSLEKRKVALKYFHAWAAEKDLILHQMRYIARVRESNKLLQFSEKGDTTTEDSYQNYYFSSALSEKAQEKLKKKLDAEPELVVFINFRPSHCAQCNKEQGKGTIIYVEEGQSYCMKCAGFNDLVLLPSGNAALTRTTKKYSPTNLVVVKFSRTRKRYERQGLLVEEKALQQAAEELEINLDLFA